MGGEAATDTHKEGLGSSSRKVDPLVLLANKAVDKAVHIKLVSLWTLEAAPSDNGVAREELFVGIKGDQHWLHHSKKQYFHNPMK